MNKPLMQSRFGNKYKSNFDRIFGKNKPARIKKPEPELTKDTQAKDEPNPEDEKGGE